MSEESNRYGVELAFRVVVDAVDERSAVNWAHQWLHIHDPRSNTLLMSSTRKVARAINEQELTREAGYPDDWKDNLAAEYGARIMEAKELLDSPEANEPLSIFEDESLDDLRALAHAMADDGYTIDEILSSIVPVTFLAGYDKADKENSSDV